MPEYKPNSIHVLRPELVPRLVNPADAKLSVGSQKKIRIWCDGLVQGKDAHDRRSYQHSVRHFTGGGDPATARNGCPVCKWGGEAEWIQNRLPGLVPRLVNPADAKLSVGSQKKVTVWCDGLVQGKEAHDRRSYQQPIISFTGGGYPAAAKNGCPVCRLGGESEWIQNRFPEMVARLVNPADARLPVSSDKKITVWCDGIVQGKDAHERRSYQQAVKSFTGRGDPSTARNGCPVCSTSNNKYSERLAACQVPGFVEAEWLFSS